MSTTGKIKLFKPLCPKPVQGTWWNQPPGPGAVHMGIYTPILKVGKGTTPRNEAASPIFEAPVKPRTTI